MGCLIKNNAFKAVVAFLPGLLFFNVDGNAQNTTLQAYIKDGLENNLALQQKKDDYSKSIEVLREANGMFFPSVSLNARYTTAQGGRVIEFPVGDLLNGVYINRSIN